MRVHRQVALLGDALDGLNQRLVQAKHQLPKASREEHIALAWQLFTPLELEFIREEIAHCIEQRTYYLENYHVIQTEQGILTCMSPLFDHQWLVENALQEEIVETGQGRIIVLKPRQAGITEYANGVMCWRTFLLPNAYTISVAQAPDVAAHIQRKVNIAYDHLPFWMQPERQYHSKGEYLEFNRKDLVERTSDPGLGSVFVTTHAQRDSGVAIGRTIRSAHFSEMSRWASGDILVGDIDPSMNASDTVAIGESTALGSDGIFFNLWTEAIEGDSDWRPVFLPVYRAKKFSLLLKPRQRPFVLTPLEQAARDRVQAEEQFMITDEFFNWRRRRLKASIKRTGFPYAHYESYPMTPTEAFQSSGISAFPRHKLDEQDSLYVRNPGWLGEIIFQGMNMQPQLLLSEVAPGQALEKREFENRLYVWEQPTTTDVYYVSADVAAGIAGGDFDVAEVWRAGSGNSPDVQVAEWVGYEQPVAFAKILNALGFWYNRSEIAVEYQSEGMQTANYLQNDLEYPKLYRPSHRDKVGKQLAAFMHWQTTSKTKPLIVSTMTEALLDNTVIIRSRYLLAEMRKFSRDGLGWSGLGSHDDSVMSSMIGLFCLRETMPELHRLVQAEDGANQVGGRGARPNAGSAVYGLYDEWFRMRGQTPDLSIAQKLVEQHPNWQIKPVPVTKANTAYSIIHHGKGVEAELYREHGLDSKDILPGLVGLYRGARSNGGDAEEFNRMMDAGEVLVGMGE